MSHASKVLKLMHGQVEALQTTTSLHVFIAVQRRRPQMAPAHAIQAASTQCRLQNQFFLQTLRTACMLKICIASCILMYCASRSAKMQSSNRPEVCRKESAKGMCKSGQRLGYAGATKQIHSRRLGRSCHSKTDQCKEAKEEQSHTMVPVSVPVLSKHTTSTLAIVFNFSGTST